GLMYDKGHGVPQDYAEALKWYRLAAKQGNADAQNNLGLMYRLGQGVPRDMAEAVRWWRLAAQQRNVNAQFGLWNSYNGATFDHSPGWIKAYEWIALYKWIALSKAGAKPGSSDDKGAFYIMSELSTRMTPAQIALAQQEASAWWAAHHQNTQ
ncbi:Sel1 repeat family, partial [mine drainage metagenome]